MTEKDKGETGQDKSPELQDDWLIRPCTIYDQEYKECTSIKGRFHQYFIFGESLDCVPWKRDYDNCCRWEDKNDIKSAKEIIESEKARRKTRLTAHYGNTVWTKRTSPPENWNAPLPEHIQKEYEASYLNIKSKEMKGEIPPQIDPSRYCIIM